MSCICCCTNRIGLRSGRSCSVWVGAALGAAEFGGFYGVALGGVHWCVCYTGGTGIGRVTVSGPEEKSLGVRSKN